MIRSREHTICKGENPTTYFFAKEAIRKNKSVIKKLYSIDDLGRIKVIEYQNEILGEIQRYYTTLFKKHNTIDLRV